MGIERRTFLKLAGAACAGLALPAVGQAKPRSKGPKSWEVTYGLTFARFGHLFCVERRCCDSRGYEMWYERWTIDGKHQSGWQPLPYGRWIVADTSMFVVSHCTDVDEVVITHLKKSQSTLSDNETEHVKLRFKRHKVVV